MFYFLFFKYIAMHCGHKLVSLCTAWGPRESSFLSENLFRFLSSFPFFFVTEPLFFLVVYFCIIQNLVVRRNNRQSPAFSVICCRNLLYEFLETRLLANLSCLSFEHSSSLMTYWSLEALLSEAEQPSSHYKSSGQGTFLIQRFPSILVVSHEVLKCVTYTVN